MIINTATEIATLRKYSYSRSLFSDKASLINDLQENITQAMVSNLETLIITTLLN